MALPRISCDTKSPLIIDVINISFPSSPDLRKDIVIALQKINGMDFGFWCRTYEVTPRNDVDLGLDGVEMREMTILKKTDFPPGSVVAKTMVVRSLVAVVKSSNELIPWVMRKV